VCAYAYSSDGVTDPVERARAAGDDAVAGAVREDIRQTLRTAWVDPAFEAAAAHPAFFAAAWSAIRPNVGKSFLVLARTLRADAADACRSFGNGADLRKRLSGDLSDEELRRLEDVARAAHLATAKAQIVVHALFRAARRERLGGTGREEAPIRRGIPDWQRWMSPQPAAPGAIDPLAGSSGRDSAPTFLRAFARWPAAASALWEELRPAIATDGWASSTKLLRRRVLAGVASLPHPIELQWTALRERGFSEADRLSLADVLGARDASMPAQTLSAAFAWVALGEPEIGMEA
jgi:hypothetical protein